MKLLCFVMLSLSCVASHSFVYENEAEALEKGFLRHEGVINCASYPEHRKRFFYFSTGAGAKVPLEQALSELEPTDWSHQADCLRAQWKEGDKVYSFKKELGSSREEGFALVREGTVVAVAFTLAIYA